MPRERCRLCQSLDCGCVLGRAPEAPAIPVGSEARCPLGRCNGSGYRPTPGHDWETSPRTFKCECQGTGQERVIPATDRHAQPGAILRDSEKALRLYEARDFDRFDDLCTTDFWVRMARILREELVKALGLDEHTTKTPSGGER